MNWIPIIEKVDQREVGMFLCFRHVCFLSTSSPFYSPALLCCVTRSTHVDFGRNEIKCRGLK